MALKGRSRWPPSMPEFRKAVAAVCAEMPTANVTEIFRAVRRRCPEWAVTPHRVRKALASMARSRKKAAKSSGSGALGSGEDALRAFPHDVVELASHASRSKHAPWQWRGQVLRVAGYDDGETPDEEDKELPPNHCSVFWLGHGLEQWPNALTKESSVRVLDRPWVLGDRVARREDPRSLGTIVGVSCRLRFCGVGTASCSGGAARVAPQPSSEVPVQSVPAVGGFRAEDWVANEATRWVGKVEEAVFRVEVELLGRSEGRPIRGKGRRRPPACVFEVSSEGLQGLGPAGREDVTPQELSPHFPGQRVRAPARLWRQAEWIRGNLGRRSPRRGVAICGVVTSVECRYLAVRWLAGAVKDSQPPDEWVEPSTLRLLSVPNSSEGWAIGDHVQASLPGWQSPSAVIVESSTVVSVSWADGRVEEGVPALRLCPRPHVSAHDFLPNDFVARSEGGLGGLADAGAPAAPEGGSPDMGVPMQVEAPNANADVHYGDTPMPSYTSQQQDADSIVPVEHMAPMQADAPLGVVRSVDLQARTAVVQWASGSQAGQTEEVSVFELTDHPQVDVRLGDAVLIPNAEDRQWAGRVCELQANGQARVELLDGTSLWKDVWRLLVIDDGDGSESADEGSGSEEASARSDGAASEAEASEANQVDDEEFAEAEAASPAAGGPVAAQQQAEQPAQASEVQKDPLTNLAAGLLGLAAGYLGLGASPSGEAAPSSAAAPAEAADGPAAMVVEAEREAVSQPAEAAASAPSALPAFDMCDDDVEPADHFFLTHTNLATRSLMAAVRREMGCLKSGLPELSTGPAPIVVRTFGSRSDLFRAMVVGPTDTPYSYVPFFFDFALPSDYPQAPPMAHFHAHFVGNERINPNLYVDGKVCLSLLGTWPGPAWDPQRSTLLQVLVSLQGLVLVEEPYYNEPGHECDAGTEQGRQASALYSEHARLFALRAALNVASSPPLGFSEIVADYFSRYGPELVREAEEALEGPSAGKSSEGFRKVLAKMLPRLRDRFAPRTAAGAGAGASASGGLPSGHSGADGGSPQSAAAAASQADAADVEGAASASSAAAAPMQ